MLDYITYTTSTNNRLYTLQPKNMGRSILYNCCRFTTRSVNVATYKTRSSRSSIQQRTGCKFTWVAYNSNISSEPSTCLTVAYMPQAMSPSSTGFHLETAGHEWYSATHAGDHTDTQQSPRIHPPLRSNLLIEDLPPTPATLFPSTHHRVLYGIRETVPSRGPQQFDSAALRVFDNLSMLSE